jgi:hypothetical protein
MVIKKTQQKITMKFQVNIIKELIILKYLFMMLNLLNKLKTKVNELK